ncbi:PHD finger protein ALFIN-LIKE 1, partial [Mucuna pruriens]
MALKFHTVEEIYADFSGRRTALIDALTDRSVDEFHRQCDPVIGGMLNDTSVFLLDREGLCLYGFPSKVWEVNLPSLKYLADFPDPTPGINFLRDGMNRKDWVSLIAVYSDSWLLSMAFYLGSCLDRNERKRLFSLINGLPTLSEIVNGKNPIESKGGSGRNESYEEDSDQKTFTRNSSSDDSSEGDSDARSETLSENDNADEQNETLSGIENPDEDENSEIVSGIGKADEGYEENVVITVCGICGGNFNADQCWICCDKCDKLFHGKCVNITPDEAESMEEYT